jgi:hypothetical protein
MTASTSCPTAGHGHAGRASDRHVTACLFTMLLAACGGGGTTSNSTIGGSISGLGASGLVLANGADTVSPASGAPTFALPTALSSGTAYDVTVSTQPAGETCSVTQGSGTVAASDITNVQVTCAPNRFSIGGSISGLTTTGLTIANGIESLNPPPGSLAFTFLDLVNQGAPMRSR